MTTQAAQRRTGGFNPTHLIAAAPDGWTALAGAVLSLAVADCRAGDSAACAWIVVGEGRHWLSLLLPTVGDEAVLYQRLRATVPDVIQLPMFTGIGVEI